MFQELFQQIFDPKKTVRHVSFRQMRNDAKARENRIEFWVTWTLRGLLIIALVIAVAALNA